MPDNWHVKGYKLNLEQEALSPSLIIKELGRSLFATNTLYYKSLHSTNIRAKALASDGAPEGTMVIAEVQTSGRGRMGRRWFSPAYRNLLFSLLLRPKIQKEQIFALTMILALATIDGVEDVSGLLPMIKWPNDLYVGRKKLAGILTEFSLRDGETDYVILGLGLNVNWRPEGEREISNPATSIFAETGIKVSRNDLLIRILRFLDSYYHDVRSGSVDFFYKRWNALSLITGREVDIESEEGRISGKAVRIEYDGALIIEGEKGEEQKVISGDVSVKL